MSKEIKLAKSNTDSGRMADGALRQNFDERTQLRERHTGDVLRDHDSDAMNGVQTDEHHQMEVVHSDYHDTPQSPARWDAYPESTSYTAESPSYREAPSSPSGLFPMPDRWEDEEKPNYQPPVRPREEPFSDDNGLNTSIYSNRTQPASPNQDGAGRVPSTTYQTRQDIPQNQPVYRSDTNYQQQPECFSPFHPVNAVFQSERSAPVSSDSRNQHGSGFGVSRSDAESSTVHHAQRPTAYEDGLEMRSPNRVQQSRAVDAGQRAYESPHVPQERQTVYSEGIQPVSHANKVVHAGYDAPFSTPNPRQESYQGDVPCYQQDTRSGQNERVSAYVASNNEVLHVEYCVPPVPQSPRQESYQGDIPRYQQDTRSGQPERAMPFLSSGSPKKAVSENGVPPDVMDDLHAETKLVHESKASVLAESTPEEKPAPLSTPKSGRSSARLADESSQSPETLIRLAKKDADMESALNPSQEPLVHSKSTPAHAALKDESDAEAAFTSQLIEKDAIPLKTPISSDRSAPKVDTGREFSELFSCGENPKRSMRTKGSASHSDRSDEQGIFPLGESKPDGESRSTPIYKGRTAKAPKKFTVQKPESRLDRMLKSKSAQQMNPDKALRSTVVDSSAALGTGRSATPDDIPLKSTSKPLKRHTALRLLAGAAAVTSSAAGSISASNGSGQTDDDARQVAESYRRGAGGTRSLLQGTREFQRRQAEKRAAQAGRAAASSAGKTAGEAAKKGSVTVLEGLKDAASEIIATAGEALVPVVVVIIALLLIVLIVMSIFTSTAGSPYGIFFVHDQPQEIEFDAAISRITNSYYNRIFSQQMSNDYENIEVICNLSDSEQIWKEIVAVYAVDVCKEGMDAITMDADHYEILKDVFWQKVKVSFRTSTRTERVETVVREAYSYTITKYYDPDGNETSVLVSGGHATEETINVPAEIEVSYIIHRTLHVTVSEKTLEQVENHYHFTDGEKDTADDLLQENDDLWAELTADFTNLIISSGGAAGAVDVTSYASVGETVYRALIANGYSKQAACGILGNIQQECSMNPQCWTGSAYGLCQWMGGRLENLQRLNNWQSPEVQTGFMISELAHSTGIWSTYGGSMGYTYSGVRITSLSAFKSCTNVRAAAGAFCVCFERSNEFPGDYGYDNRLDYAVSWYNYAQSHWEN